MAGVSIISLADSFDGVEGGGGLGDGAGALFAFGAEFVALGLEDFFDEGLRAEDDGFAEQADALVEEVGEG